MTDNPGTTLSPSAKAERNRRVAADRATGLSWDTIAARHGLSVRQARRAMHEALTYGSGSGSVDPWEALDRVLRAHLHAIDRLQELSSSRNGSVAVGAARSVAPAAVSYLAVLERAGLLPESPRAWTFAQDIPTVLAAIGEACDETGVPREEVARRLGVVLDAAGAGERALDAAEALT